MLARLFFLCKLAVCHLTRTSSFIKQLYDNHHPQLVNQPHQVIVPAHYYHYYWAIVARLVILFSSGHRTCTEDIVLFLACTRKTSLFLSIFKYQTRNPANYYQKGGFFPWSALLEAFDSPRRPALLIFYNLFIYHTFCRLA